MSDGVFTAKAHLAVEAFHAWQRTAKPGEPNQWSPEFVRLERAVIELEELLRRSAVMAMRGELS